LHERLLEVEKVLTLYAIEDDAINGVFSCRYSTGEYRAPQFNVYLFKPSNDGFCRLNPKRETARVRRLHR